MQYESDVFVTIPVGLLDAVGPREVAVYAALARRVDNRTRRCWPSHQTIAADAKVSISAVKRSLAALRKAGYVSWGAKVRADGSRGSNIYALHGVATHRGARSDAVEVEALDVEPDEGYLDSEPPESDPTPRSHRPTPRSDRPGGVGLTERPRTITKNELEEPPHTPPLEHPDGSQAVAAIPSDFDEFWSAYPRKVGKGAARRAWAQATTAGVSPADMIAGARRYAADPNRPSDVRYVPHPATWLRAERWLDEPEPAPPERRDIFDEAKRLARGMNPLQPGTMRALEAGGQP